MGAEEHTERWASAKALTVESAIAEMPEVERKYNLECAEYSNVLYGLSDEFSAIGKLDTEQLAKLADLGKLQAQLDSGAYVAVDGAQTVSSAEDLSKAVEGFETSKDK